MLFFWGKRRAREHRALIYRLECIVMQNKELYDAVAALSDQMNKVKTEIVTKVADLEAALNSSGSVPADVAAAFASVKAAVDTLDAIVPDAQVAVDPNAGSTTTVDPNASAGDTTTGDAVDPNAPVL